MVVSKKSSNKIPKKTIHRKKSISEETSTIIDDTIQLKGVRTHNLKNFDITLPKNKLITITGVSGSGKSSLAFHTIYKE